jgi:hypothetical protein
MIGPALQGAALLSRAGQVIPWALTAASFAPGIVQGAQQILNRPSASYNPGGGGMGGRRGTRGQSSTALTGREKINKSWELLGSAAEPAGGNFGYRTGNGKPYSQPSYADAQGNIYDAVSGRLLYPAKTRPGAGAGSSAEGASSFLGGSPAAERAYQSEASRVAQMTEQDPLFKKYRIGELTKAYNAAKGDEREKIGLEIWATTNPELARKLKPGQLGYEEATSAFQSISPLGQFQAQTGDMQYANNMTQPIAEFGTINPYNQQALNMPLTGIQVPLANQIGTKEVFAASSPIPGATQAFTDPLQFLTTEDTSEIQKALIKKKFDELIK